MNLLHYMSSPIICLFENKHEISSKPIITNNAQTSEVTCFNIFSLFLIPAAQILKVLELSNMTFKHSTITFL